MANVLGIDAVFHDPAAALVSDGRIADGRPMGGHPRDALERVATAPIDALPSSHSPNRPAARIREMVICPARETSWP